MVYKLQSMHPKQNQRQVTHESNKYMHAWNWKIKPTRSVKKNKNNFVNAIGDKFAMCTRWGKLTVSFCKKLFSCTNYLQLLKQIAED